MAESLGRTEAFEISAKAHFAITCRDFSEDDIDSTVDLREAV